MSDTPKLLLLLRHAQAEDFAPGRSDEHRSLTDAGRDQARRVGEFLTEQGIRADRLICSPALRTRQTAELLNQREPEFVAELYNAGSDTIRGHVTESENSARVVLVVGHAPGVPTLAHDLADEGDSEPTALAAIARGYPTATLSVLEVDGPWSELSRGRLSQVWRG
ncbi:histidine phosphatase family protein [Naumannella sp. ID2617S]|uniref:Phosphohistidine phosphatase n=1 Tax=Enemella dayhoffiae TaxID=2016507 RepID=A0A255H951_9ACTN|nr:histidine phosphatase family protein [Enemella dayhoffiae]NNG20872.1 histidine phosphatase family protein [Naumannella sp. ID2617S]OYO24119.1 phosphohistidine phosphatase [Enemella dayhoffiae]